MLLMIMPMITAFLSLLVDGNVSHVPNKLFPIYFVCTGLSQQSVSIVFEVFASMNGRIDYRLNHFHMKVWVTCYFLPECLTKTISVNLLF
jgi:hypothetical protein